MSISFSKSFHPTHHKRMPFFWSFTRGNYINHSVIFTITIKNTELSMAISWLNKKGKF